MRHDFRVETGTTEHEFAYEIIVSFCKWSIDIRQGNRLLSIFLWHSNADLAYLVKKRSIAIKRQIIKHIKIKLNANFNLSQDKNIMFVEHF